MMKKIYEVAMNLTDKQEDFLMGQFIRWRKEIDKGLAKGYTINRTAQLYYDNYKAFRLRVLEGFAEQGLKFKLSNKQFNKVLNEITRRSYEGGTAKDAIHMYKVMKDALKTFGKTGDAEQRRALERFYQQYPEWTQNYSDNEIAEQQMTGSIL